MRSNYILLTFCFLFLLCACFQRHYRADLVSGERNGGFQRVPFFDQEDPPDMILIEGKIEPFSKDNNYADTLNSFYISTYEETNGQYLSYVRYIKKYYSDATYKSVLPDTTVWKNETIAQEEKDYLIKNYFRDPAYKNFPVVGVSPKQVERYAWWKTDRMNEFILLREDIFSSLAEPRDSTDVFTTLAYLMGQYHPSDYEETRLIDLDPKQGWSRKRADLAERIVRIEDGILMPRYRLVFLEEWQHAAHAIGDENFRYPKTDKFSLGKYHENISYSHLKITRDKKDVSAGSAFIQKIGCVYDHIPNNYRVYGLAGGVSEIVQVDSLSYCHTGGSWKMEEDYSAVYKKEPGTYWYPNSFMKPDLIDSMSQGIVGFRFAMDRSDIPYGGPPDISDTKRSKGN